jgi:hypothetical protein
MLELLVIIFLEGEPPPASQVKAGPLGFAVWIFMVVAVALLGWSLVRQLRKADNNRKAGVFGDAPEVDDTPADSAPADSGTGDGAS